MGRKSKQAGSGHFPLTNYERKEYGKPYGTTSARLSGSSQYTFGQCALSLHPAKDSPVATHSGYVYERPAILEYLLSQTQKLKKAQQKYDQWLATQEARSQQQQEASRKRKLEAFEDAQKVVTKQQKREQINPLKRTSYWLAEVQPEVSGDPSEVPIPPQRPPSPMSQQPLRRKDLIPLDLKRNTGDQVICAVSEKSIVTQQALALITKGDHPAQVVLEQVYEDLISKEEQKGAKRMCPVTGRKLTKILKLQKGGSSFAANGGILEAKTYRPSMT